MDAKWGIMMCELKGRMDKGGYHHVEIKMWLQQGNLVCKLRGWMDKGGHYDVQMKRWLQKGALCGN